LWATASEPRAYAPRTAALRRFEPPAVGVSLVPYGAIAGIARQWILGEKPACHQPNADVRVRGAHLRCRDSLRLLTAVLARVSPS